LHLELPSRFRRFENEQCKQLPSREDNKENDSTLFLPMRLFTQAGPEAAVRCDAAICPVLGVDRTLCGEGEKGAPVKVFGCRPHDGGATCTGGRRTKTSKGGNRGREAAIVPRARATET
jgi:hypothetical protein